VALTLDAAAACRFVGVQLDEEIVLLDCRTNSLIHLNATAARVWEACPSADGENDDGTRAGGESGRDIMSVKAVLEDAGILRRVNGEYVRVAIEWS
jgi:coenzyme PQQ synthesis protein D (PqqD)